LLVVLGWVGLGWVTRNGPMDNSGLFRCSRIASGRAV